MSTILVAYSKNGRVIGKDNKLPWKLTKDLEIFKHRTIGQAVIMGRKTYESLNCKPLRHRLNIVLSKSNIDTENAILCDCPHKAIDIANKEGFHPYIIGGQQIYNAFLQLKLVKQIIATEVEIDVKGDAFFSKLSCDWTATHLETYNKNNSSEPMFHLVRYTR